MNAMEVLARAIKKATINRDEANYLAGVANKQLDFLRSHLQREMTANSIKTLDSDGMKATIRNKRYTNVVDEVALRQHISSLDRDYDFTTVKFDLAKAKREGAKENWPGLEIEDRSELVVTVDKDES